MAQESWSLDDTLTLVASVGAVGFFIFMWVSAAARQAPSAVELDAASSAADDSIRRRALPRFIAWSGLALVLSVGLVLAHVSRITLVMPVTVALPGFFALYYGTELVFGVPVTQLERGWARMTALKKAGVVVVVVMGILGAMTAAGVALAGR